MVDGTRTDLLRLAEGEPGDPGVARLEPNFIIGYTTRTHLLLDLDDTSIEKARRLADLIIHQWPELGDCLILQSSLKPLNVGLKYSWNNHPWMSRESPNYHLVFNNRVGYNKCCKICEVLAWLGVLNKDYTKIRTFRGDMTLRVSHQNLSTGAVKPPPEPVELVLNLASKWSDGMINEYLAFRYAVLGRPAAAKVVTEVRAHGCTAKGLQN
ncbi:MAG: hypothetical protein MUP64_16180 [Anaerolineae bacterium]|nr:hypothetical protein [Anaerolineae bacterium]